MKLEEVELEVVDNEEVELKEVATGQVLAGGTSPASSDLSLYVQTQCVMVYCKLPSLQTEH